MQWSQIKNVFILAFLLLNVYLIYQFNEKREQADVPVFEQHESTIEYQLELENIEISDLPEGDLKETYISVNQRLFTEEEFEEISDIEGQEMMLINRNLIATVFEEPIPMSEEDSTEEIEEILGEYILFPEEYSYWDWNKDANIIMFFQNKRERSIYFNQNGLVLFYLNDENDVIAYTQTMLDDVTQRQEEKTLIKPLTAIEILYNENNLNDGDKITEVNIGFHTRVPLENGEQIFVPTWKVVVNDDRDYFVNAIEGLLFSGDELEFLEDATELTIERLTELETDRQVMKEFMLELLQQKMNRIIGGE